MECHNREEEEKGHYDHHMQLVIPAVGHLKHLRNSLEHLAEADLSGNAAVAIEGTKTWSLDKLPGKALSLSIHVGPSRDEAFGVIEIDVIEDFANQVIHEIERVSDYLASEMANPY